MIDSVPVKNLLKNADRVTSDHLVVAEWNMNRYQKISKYGIYEGNVTDGVYSSGTDPINTGKNVYLYDDNSIKETDNSEYFSSIASIFEPLRPDPGIVLLQKVGFISDIGFMKGSKINTASPRYYPFTKSRSYDYFNSGKYIKNGNSVGFSDKVSGAIQNANPFVVYEDEFPTNKIVIKIQNHAGVPKEWAVQVLDSGSWDTIYTSNSSAVWADGILNLYFSSGSWSLTETRADNLDEISNPNTQLKMIKGIRFQVDKMTIVSFTDNAGVTKKYKSSLEIIEMSPRIEYDLTSYTESFSLNSSLSDNDLGLPVGAIVSSTGDITLSNETKEFLLSSSAAAYRMLTPDVEFRFYQKFNIESTEYIVPLGTMYANSWNIGSDFTAQISLSDKFKFFQDVKVPDILLNTKNGIPFSVLALMLLDNCGITGYEFKKSSNNADGEDVRIKNFWCNKEQTLAQVLEELAVGTQSAIFMDALGKLNILTKERISKSVNYSNTDYWMVFDEEYPPVGQYEYNYISDYTANVISTNDSLIDPITDGGVKYHTYGIKISAGGNLLKELVPEELLNDIPANSIIGSDRVYETRTVWQPGNDQTAVLGAANLIETVGNKNIYDASVLGNQTVTASNNYDALRKFYDQAIASGSSVYNNVRVRLDNNDAYMFGDYSGYVLIDDEFIEYEGLIYKIQNTSSVVFSREELDSIINSLDLRDSLFPQGLLIKMRLDSTPSTTETSLQTYTVVKDGRGQFDSKIRKHIGFTQSDTDPFVTKDNKLNIIIGAKSNKGIAREEYPKSLQYYDFTETLKKLKKVKRILNIDDSSLKTYLGYLRLIGPKTKQDTTLLSLTSSANTASPLYVENQFKKANREVNAIVPGKDFDGYVYTTNERYIYAQKTDLNLTPDRIGVRMRLYAGRRDEKQDSLIASTMSSIAGIGFAARIKTETIDGKEIKTINSGYFLEVESIGSNIKDTSKSTESLKQNLRFYKLYRDEDGILTPKLLARSAVNVMTVLNADAYVLNDPSITTDGVFELEISIKEKNNKAQFDIFYGGQSILSASATDKIIDNVGKNGLWDNNNKNLFLFVRGDSQAIFEDVYAIETSKIDKENNINDSITEKDTSLLIQKFNSGGLSSTRYKIFKNNSRIKYFYEDFGKIVRQVKKYTPRFEVPVQYGRLIDISNINPKYMVKESSIGSFGAEIIVVNTSNSAILLSENSDLPLYIMGYQLEELSSGEIKISDYYTKVEEDGKKSTDLAFNKAVYGAKSFTLDNKYITSSEAANNLIQWVIQNCSKQRYSFQLEIFPNPLLEIGDKIKIYYKDRGYNQQNSLFGDKTFVIKDISRSISTQGPSMNIVINEVGGR